MPHVNHAHKYDVTVHQSFILMLDLVVKCLVQLSSLTGLRNQTSLCRYENVYVLGFF